MVVRLPKTGTVVLTSDAVYLQENLDKNILPSVGSVYDPVGMLDAYAWVQAGSRRRGRRYHLRARPRYLQGAQALSRILRVTAQPLAAVSESEIPGVAPGSSANRPRDCFRHLGL